MEETKAQRMATQLADDGVRIRDRQPGYNIVGLIITLPQTIICKSRYQNKSSKPKCSLIEQRLSKLWHIHSAESKQAYF